MVCGKYWAEYRNWAFFVDADISGAFSAAAPPWFKGNCRYTRRNVSLPIRFLMVPPAMKENVSD